MNQNISISATLDLSSFNEGDRPCTGNLIFDDTDNPYKLDLSIDLIGAETIHAFLDFSAGPILKGQEISGTTEDGREFRTELTLLAGVGLTSNSSLSVNFRIDNTVFIDKGESPKDVVRWLFPLMNWRIHIADEVTTRENGRGWVLNKIRFILDGREWLVVDHTFGDKKRLSELDDSHPIRTATLETEALPGEQIDRIGESASDICRLFSFALGRRVNWRTTVGLDANGGTAALVSQNRHLTPYRLKGNTPVDNFEKGTIKGFVETAYTVMLRDRDWFSLTLEYFLQATLAPFIDIRSVILNILFDRITDYVLGATEGFQIDDDLKSKMDSSFADSISELFSAITPSWTHDRTQALISQVNLWNAKPSFAKGIKRSCGLLGIPEPDSKLLAVRHKLLHLGELDPKDGDIRNYWIELDWLALSMVLRLFNYDGLVYHHKFGAQPVILADLISPGDDAH